MRNINMQGVEGPFETELRWPKSGDDPFAMKTSAWDSARIQQNVESRFYGMVSGYRSAADSLVDRAVEDRFERDVLVYPILFLYRHAIELELKWLLSNYGRQAGIQPVWNSHELKPLWEKLLQVFEALGVEDPDETNSHVAFIVAQFSKIDPRSFSNRYPVDTKGIPIPVEREELDLAVLKDVLAGVFSFFDGCDGYLSELVAAGP